MLYPIEWLKEFVEINVPPAELARLLNFKSFETVVKNSEGLEYLEVETLPNRGDSLSIIGLAREIGAVLKTSFKDKPTKNVFGKANEISQLMTVEVKDKKLCPRYMVVYIKGVKIKPSSARIQKRLAACGIRPINNVVDATNYLLVERGQPLHAFDAAKISGKKIIVRTAAAGEEISTLDGAARKLTSSMLVIADAARPVAVAGIMGGANSEVSDSTGDVLLESAYFDPLSVRRTSFALGLRTEASSRFEKGVDFENVALALAETAALIKEEAGGQIIEGFIDAKDEKFHAPRILKLRIKRVEDILGIKISPDEISKILSFLGFNMTPAGTAEFQVSVPAWRHHDVEREIDLIEEIIRIHGYESIPSTLPGKTITDTESPRSEKLVRTTRRVMTTFGFNDAYNFSLGNQKEIDWLDLPADHSWRSPVVIQNPLTEDQTLLYPTLLVSLLKNIAFNQNRQQTEVALFEIGRVFLSAGSGKSVEELNLAAAWLNPKADFFEFKGILENVFEVMRVFNYSFKPASLSFLQPGKSAEIIDKKGQVWGYLGVLSPNVTRSFDLNSQPMVFEISLDKAFKLVDEKKYFKPLPKFPAVFRDIAIIIDKKIAYQEVLQLIEKTGGPLLEKVELFDTYEGSQIPAGSISLAISLTFRSAERTLVETEVTEAHRKIVKSLEEKFGAKLR